MKKIVFLFTAVTFLTGMASAIPSEINYQGTLRGKDSVPVTENNVPMAFSIYDKNKPEVKTPVWRGEYLVTVTAGLFSQRLSPVGVDWQNITPELEVSIKNNVLSPREPITATIYATVAGSVVDSSVKLRHLAPEVVSVPPGAILMFNTGCPLGWTAFSDLNGRFPLGQVTPGLKGGNNTHGHSLATAEISVGRNGAGNVGWSDDVPAAQKNSMSNWGGTPGPYTVNIASRYTEDVSNVPLFYGVVFCTKN